MGGSIDVNYHVIDRVSSHISVSGEAELPPEVIRKTKHHILDTLAAIVSGSALKPGLIAKEYVEAQGGTSESQVAGSPVVTTAINAAMANGIMAHADETDDSHAKSLTHPGCAVVPAALAAAEREESDGIRFLKGVVAGYDIGCRITQAAGVDYLNSGSRSTHAIGGCFGAAAAAASVLGLKEDRVCYVLSYAAQQASGVLYWLRDEEHIEKAFVFGGMPARNGVTSAVLVHSGFTGVSNPFSGENNFFEAFSLNPHPEMLVEGLGNRYEIMFTNIKKYSVGSPIQAALDALLLLIEKHGLRSNDVENISVRLPDEGARVVNDREMPDINLQHILAVALLDGELTFETAHSVDRMKDPAILHIKKSITLVGDPELTVPEAMRQGIVEVTTKDGERLKEHVVNVGGTAENPMSTEEVERKCRELLAPVLGKDRSEKLIDRIWNLEQVGNVRELRPLFSAH
ncbi:MmgE/PrpD family protein [Thermodesulfobacteriota bacterium]